jgi:hypothetical protein
MPRRLLNIASIFCLVVCLALMGMWVRSYWLYDRIDGYSTTAQFTVCSTQGVAFCENLAHFPVILDLASWKSFPMAYHGLRPPTFLGFRYRNESAGIFIVLPYWFLVLVTGSLSAVLWWRPAPRFSLPVLLLMTTIIAAALAIVVELNCPPIGK